MAATHLGHHFHGPTLVMVHEAVRHLEDVVCRVQVVRHDERIPLGIHNGAAFEKWLREAEAKSPRRPICIMMSCGMRSSLLPPKICGVM